MAEQGLEIVNFTGGTLDDTPTLVKNATKQAIDEGFGSGLTDSSGLHELREAISESLSSDKGICVNPKREIIITVGAKKCYLYGSTGNLKCWGRGIDLGSFLAKLPSLSHLSGRYSEASFDVKKGGAIQDRGGKYSKFLKSKKQDADSKHTTEPYRKSIHERGNQTVCAVSKEKGLTVLSDECYKQALHNGNEHYSIASFPGMQERTIIVYSFSKAYTMYGWRVGYAVANEHVISRMVRIQSNCVSCPTSSPKRSSRGSSQWWESRS